METVEECLAACAHVKAGSDGSPGCNTVNFLPNNCRLKKCQPCAEEPCWKTGVRLTGHYLKKTRIPCFLQILISLYRKFVVNLNTEFLRNFENC